MNSGWGGGSAFILFLILVSLISSCQHQKEQAQQLERIADKIVTS